MTVQSQLARADYNGNGVTTTPFPVPFRFLQNSHLKVLRTVIATNVTTELVLDSLGPDGFSVTGAGLPSGGVVTVVTAPAIGERLSILRNMPFTQLIDYIANDAFPAESHETGLDERTMENGQLLEVVGRAITLPPGIAGVSTDLPGPQALYLLRWNALANALENVQPPAIATVADGAVVDATVSPIAAIQSNKLDFLQSGASAIHQTIQDKLRRNLLDVKDFGALGDNATDDTAAFHACIAECQARGGGTILVPPGQYVVTAITVPDGNSVLLEGVGPSSNIKCNLTGGDILTIIPWYSGITNIKVSGNPSRTSGSNINLSGVSGFAYKCYIEGDFTGIRMSGVGCKIVECEFFYAAANADRIYATGGDTSQLIRNCIMYATTGVHAGIYVDNSAALKIYDNDIVSQGISLLVSPGNGQHVFSLWSRGNFYDSATAGILINPSGTGQVTRVAITDDWASSHMQNGIQLIATGTTLIDGVDIDGCETHLNGGNGVGLLGNQVKNVRIRGQTARGNGAGLSLDACVNVAVEGLQFGTYGNLGANTTGIFIANSPTYRITGGDLRGQNVVGFAVGSPTQIISGLWGFEQPRASVGTAIPFQNSWVNYTGLPGYQTAKFWKDEFGVVHLCGVIASGTIGNAAFTLPAGFRPSAIENFPTSNAAAFGTLEVRTTGEVIPTVGSNVSVSLNGITFLAAGSP